MFRYFFLSFNISIFLCFITTLTYSSDKLYPIDESTQDSSFYEFKIQLVEAIKNCDSNFIISILDTNVDVSFGMLPGIESFKEKWNPDNPKSPLWGELEVVLSLGGTFSDSKQSFTAPYIFSKWNYKYDPFFYAAIIDKNVNVHKESDSSSAVITTLSYDIVRKDSYPPHILWHKVVTLNGKEGYVQSKYVRSPISYRVCFEKNNGKWLMKFFIAGD